MTVLSPLEPMKGRESAGTKSTTTAHESETARSKTVAMPRLMIFRSQPSF